MNKVSIDLDEKLVNYIKEKCNRDITSDIEITPYGNLIN